MHINIKLRQSIFYFFYFYLCKSTKLRLHCRYSKRLFIFNIKLAHYCTYFSNTCIQFVVLSTITRECDSKILKLFRRLESCVCQSTLTICFEKHWTGCLDKHIISVLALLIFISGSKHASENRSSAYWRSLLFQLNNARSSANSRRRTLHSPNVTPLLEELSLSILSMYIMDRRGERAQPCCSPSLALKGFVFMPST